MELYIVRHGNTVANANHICQGASDGFLNELGVAQAKLLGIRLSKISFDQIFSSDLRRCKQTLGFILEFSKEEKKCEPEYIELLRERNMGCFECVPKKFVSNFLSKKVTKYPRQFRPINGESFYDVMIRATKFLNLALESNLQPAFSKIQFNFYNKLEENLKSSATKEKEKQRIKRILEIRESLEKDMSLSVDLTEEQKKFIEKIESSKVKDEKPSIDEEYINQSLSQLKFDDDFYEPYKGYEDKDKIKRILVTSHGDFLNELINVMRVRDGMQAKMDNGLKNTSLTIMRITCSKHNYYCEDTEGECKLSYDYIIYNDTKHLDYLNIKDEENQ